MLRKSIKNLFSFKKKAKQQEEITLKLYTNLVPIIDNHTYIRNIRAVAYNEANAMGFFGYINNNQLHFWIDESKEDQEPILEQAKYFIIRELGYKFGYWENIDHYDPNKMKEKEPSDELGRKIESMAVKFVNAASKKRVKNKEKTKRNADKSRSKREAESKFKDDTKGRKK